MIEARIHTAAKTCWLCLAISVATIIAVGGLALSLVVRKFAEGNDPRVKL